MLQLLRKYQKGIFIVVAITVILTFSFFGTYSAVASNAPKEKDLKIGKSLDGSAIYSKEIEDLVHFLSTDALDSPIVETKGYVNLFNDGVVKKDIFETGIGLMLLQHYYPVFEEGLKERAKKFTNFHPYRHPDAPFVSLESVWRQFVPELFEHYKEFQASGEMSPEKLEMLVALYLDQCAFPPRAARQLLYYLQQQYRHVVAFDPYLQSGELALFHAKTVEDWFGREFVEALAHFIHNASVYAYEQGYRVSKEEAKASLMKIGMDNAKMVHGAQMITPSEFSKYYARSLQMLQMDEKRAVELWQKVLLFRRLFNDVGHSVFLDKTLYEQFHHFASQGVQVEIYMMPPALQLTTERDLYKLELYLQAVAKGKGDPLGLPVAFASETEVMKKFPELVQKRFMVKVASVKRDEVERHIGLRYLMNWELEDGNFAKLQKKFPELAKTTVKEKEARYELLESLSNEKRGEVDQYALDMILEERPDFIREALVAKVGVKQEIAVPYKGGYAPLDGIEDAGAFLKLLEANDQEKLGFYSQDRETFYDIAVLEEISGAELMTFREAEERGILDRILDREWKEGLFTAQVDVMKKAVAKLGISFAGKSEAESAALCARYRFYQYLAEEKKRLQEGGEYVGSLSPIRDQEEIAKRGSFNDQFKLEKREEEYLRKQEHKLLDVNVLKMEMGEWSQMLASDKEGVLFYQVKEKIVDEKAMQKGIREGRDILSNEAKRHLMSKLLDEMDTKNVIIASS